MKALLLMRHSKAEPGGMAESDFERPLAKRGWDDSPLMGRLLADAKLIPDLVLSSPAARAWTTAKLAAGAGEFPDEPVKFDQLYEATMDTCLSIVREQPDKLETLLVVGHNPSLEEALAELSGLTRCHLPTAGLACLDVESPRWRELSRANCRLRWLVIPRLIRHLHGKHRY